MRCLAHITDDPDGHDWARAYLDTDAGGSPDAPLRRVLWACPCSEFKWTSYAEWEKRVASTITMTVTQGFAETTNAANSEITKDNIERMTRRAYNADEPEGKPGWA